MYVAHLCLTKFGCISCTATVSLQLAAVSANLLPARSPPFLSFITQLQLAKIAPLYTNPRIKQTKDIYTAVMTFVWHIILNVILLSDQIAQRLAIHRAPHSVRLLECFPQEGAYLVPGHLHPKDPLQPLSPLWFLLA